MGRMPCPFVPLRGLDNAARSNYATNLTIGTAQPGLPAAGGPGEPSAIATAGHR
jgi:hypothetical protein